MNLYITAFLTFGCFFGLATFAHRHLFSEGPHRPDADGSSRVHKGALVFWVAMCTLLWPIMAVSGLHTAWVLAKRRARADSASDSSDPSTR